MTYRLVQEVVRRYDGPAKLTLIVLADIADKDGFAWPGQTLIAARVGKHPRQVRNDLRALEEAEVLSVCPAGNDPHAGGRFGTNSYIINVETIAAMPVIDTTTVGNALPTATECRRQPSTATVGSLLPLTVGSPLPTKRTVEEDTEESFAAFWSLYPRKIARKEAEARFVKASKSTDPAVILDGLKRYVEFWASQQTEAKFIPYPATWLNRECWTDELPTPPQHDHGGDWR